MIFGKVASGTPILRPNDKWECTRMGLIWSFSWTDSLMFQESLIVEASQKPQGPERKTLLVFISSPAEDESHEQICT